MWSILVEVGDWFQAVREWRNHSGQDHPDRREVWDSAPQVAVAQMSEGILLG